MFRTYLIPSANKGPYCWPNNNKMAQVDSYTIILFNFKLFFFNLELLFRSGLQIIISLKLKTTRRAKKSAQKSKIKTTSFLQNCQVLQSPNNSKAKRMIMTQISGRKATEQAAEQRNWSALRKQSKKRALSDLTAASTVTMTVSMAKRCRGGLLLSLSGNG